MDLPIELVRYILQFNTRQILRYKQIKRNYTQVVSDLNLFFKCIQTNNIPDKNIVQEIFYYKELLYCFGGSNCRFIN